MAALLPSERRSKIKLWLPYVPLVLGVLFLLVLAALVVFYKLAPAKFVNLLDRTSPFHIGTPRISGTVVNAVTGRPVPGIDVCLLVTHIPPNFDHRAGIEVMRSETTQTDASGRFFFARWDSQRDLLEDWDGYGIAVTDPAARWREQCGRDIYLLGKADIFERETSLQSHAGSATKSAPPYFPVAMVNDIYNPHPEPYGTYVSFGHFSDGTLVRMIGDPGKLKIALVPLLPDGKDCRLAENSDFVELCREMNESPTADDLRTSWKISPHPQ
jgi:hypothetical protein